MWQSGGLAPPAFAYARCAAARRLAATLVRSAGEPTDAWTNMPSSAAGWDSCGRAHQKAAASSAPPVLSSAIHVHSGRYSRLLILISNRPGVTAQAGSGTRSGVILRRSDSAAG